MKTNFKDIITGNTPILVDFFATWCGPCKTLIPILADVKKELCDQVKIIKINLDNNQTLATQLQVRGVPTLLLFKDGKQVWRKSGVLQKDELTHIIKIS